MVSSFIGVSFHLEVLAGFSTRHDTPPPQAPSPIFGHSSHAYIAKETRIFARQLGLKPNPCFTPVGSPQSNGISEAFVKTLKRDYVRVTPLPDAETALSLIGNWIEDYNDNHPHSGLKWRSPREFIRTRTEVVSAEVVYER